MSSGAAIFFAVVNKWPMSCSSSSISTLTESMCLFGRMRIWVGAAGLISRKAVTCLSRYTFVLGISPLMILQKTHSVIWDLLKGYGVGMGPYVSLQTTS